MTPNSARDPTPARVLFPSFGMWRSRRVRRIMELAGYEPALFSTGKVAQWGAGRTSGRSRWVSARTGRPRVWIEDAFLRSLHPGREGEAPIGLLIDEDGLYYDASRPSGLERLLSEHPLDDDALLQRARDAIAMQIREDVSKYSAHDRVMPERLDDFVLVVDQAHGDKAVTLGNGDRRVFERMLSTAREEHPGSTILIKAHPETASGHRGGFFDKMQELDGVSVLGGRVSPWALLRRARAVYTVTSQLGFEAVLAGHRPVVFGQPFYAGWGLSDDRMPIARRTRPLSTEQLYAGAMLLYPKWYDPSRDALGTLETTIQTLSAEARAWREDSAGVVAQGMRLWKRGHLKKFFGASRMEFEDDPVKAARKATDQAASLLCWSKPSPELERAAEAQEIGLSRVEDGFLRSRGLGAELVPPLSLVRDRTGIYFDPAQPSDLEDLIRRSEALQPAAERRARRLREQLVELRLSKYNVGSSEIPGLPEGKQVVLVVGQVEDDASVLSGAAAPLNTNEALLEAARKARPEAFLVYKPHPDVEAGLRKGRIGAEAADAVARDADPDAILEVVDEVWTITSLMGFEALIRGVKVVCAGRPFFSGWGLTVDLPCPVDDVLGDRRSGARPTLDGLIHAALIDYPRYRDPVTGRPCPVEVVVERLASGAIPRTGPGLRLLSKLQGLLATHDPFWR